MSHNAGDAQILLSVDHVTVVPTVGTPFSISKGLTASEPALSGVRHFILPDPALVPEGMSYEIKDANGTAGNLGSKIIIMAPDTIKIDGSVDDDEITRKWGSKTYVTMNGHYIVRGDQRAIAAVASGGVDYLADFSGTDASALPTGWSSSETSNGIPWTISTDTFHTSGGNLSTAGSDYDPDITSNVLPAASAANPSVSTLTYNAGTLQEGQAISFKWLKDTWDYSCGTGSPWTTTGCYNKLHFYVNGVLVTTHNSRLNWLSFNYTVPSTGVQIFSWDWYRTHAAAIETLNNGCFVDEFTIAPIGSSQVSSFAGTDGDPLPAGWTSSTSGTGIPWTISEDTYHSSGGNVSSAGSDHDPDTTNLGAADNANPAISTLTYAAGTLQEGQVVSFKWIKDTYYRAGYSTGYWNFLRFNVNGTLNATHSSPLNWQSHTYTIPSTGTYTFSFEWTRTLANYLAGSNNGCFIDEFTIT